MSNHELFIANKALSRGGLKAQVTTTSTTENGHHVYHLTTNWMLFRGMWPSIGAELLAHGWQRPTFGGHEHGQWFYDAGGES